MKYNESNLPLYCKMSQSTWYKGTRTQTPVGVLWHSTGANNKTIKRYVQPDDSASDRDYWINLIGKNPYNNDWNHQERQAGVNAFIGTLADGTVTTVQVGPWNYRAWGCGSGSKGSCNDGWVQWEICEDNLNDKEYFDKIYKEGCELTAYICKMFNIDPYGSSKCGSTTVPNITCHCESHDYGCGSNHSDVLHWFKKYGKNMDTIRADVKAILNADKPVEPEEPTQVKTYELVVDCVRYKTATDAANRTNSVGTYEKGIYYIYNKYPNGRNGMLNISKDSSGNFAGSWINPNDNVIKEEPEQPEEPVIKEQLYRVRITWEDSKTQLGAYKQLQNAIDMCNEHASEGYKVFDIDGNIVYEPEIKEEPVPEPEEPDVPVEPEQPDEPETPVEPEVIDYCTHTKIVEIPPIAKELIVKVVKAIKEQNSDFDEDIAKAFFEVGPKYSIYPLYAISQSILETGWFRFRSGSVKPEQHNYCGLGATGGGVSGASFETIEQGVEAQYQHLYAYGCTDTLPEGTVIYDPRYELVTRGKSETWEELTGKWAVPGYDTNKFSSLQEAIKVSTIEEPETYGHKILNIAQRLLDIEVTQEEIDEFYGVEEEPEPVDPTPVDPQEPDEPDEPDIPVDPVEPETDNWFIAFLKTLTEIIVNFVKSLFNK